jgi:hypothetical protein
MVMNAKELETPGIGIIWDHLGPVRRRGCSRIVRASSFHIPTNAVIQILFGPNVRVVIAGIEFAQKIIKRQDDLRPAWAEWPPPAANQPQICQQVMAA